MVKKNGKSVAVVGAGLGGMSAAISLANKGFEVTLFEKNEKAGGKLNSLTTKGFSFDLGPSILTLPHVFRRLFDEAGKKFDDYVSIVALDHHWRNFFEDGSVIDLYADNDVTANHLESTIPGSAAQYRRFVEYSKRQYEATEATYFTESYDTFWSFFRGLKGLPAVMRMDLFRSMAQANARIFKDQRLRDIFDYFIKYVGSSAYRAPGFMNLMPWVQIHYGLWYVKGGMYNLAVGLIRLMEEIGVTLRCSSEVRSILTTHNRCTGVELAGGERHTFDYVVSNMEVIPAYEQLLKEPSSFLSSLQRFEPACSGIVLHLGLNRTYPQLAHHNFLYSRDQKHHFNLVFNEHRLPEDPTIYLVAPTRTDPSQAPPGCDNLKILPHIPYINNKHPYTVTDYENLAERVLDKLERMGLQNLRRHIVVRDFWNPFTIRDTYYSNKGAIYGVVSDRFKNFALKAPKRSSRYSNLFFVGGTVNPGAGMPMVTLSGYHTAQIIARECGVALP